VQQALETQLFEKVTACFQWPSARYLFSELDALPDELEPFALPPMEQVVHAGLRDHAPAEALSAWLAPRATQRPRLARPPAALGTLLKLDAAGLRLLGRLDGTCALGALAREQPDSLPLLATLSLSGALESAAAAAPAPRARETIRVSHPREVVGRRRGGTAPPVAAAAPAPAASPAQNRLEAEQCYRRAQQLLGADKSLEAVRLLRRAVELEPDEPEYAMVEAWVSYLDARQAVRVARARAVTAARRQLEADPKAPRAHTILGRLALDEGDTTRAIREFELALLRDPEDDDAKRGLKQARS
jgi:Flp pilus assembly protein TadD